MNKYCSQEWIISNSFRYFEKDVSFTILLIFCLFLSLFQHKKLKIPIRCQFWGLQDSRISLIEATNSYTVSNIPMHYHFYLG